MMNEEQNRGVEKNNLEKALEKEKKDKRDLLE